MKAELTKEQEQAVDAHHGFVEAAGEHGTYVVMSMQVFREMMGVGTDEEMAVSVAVLEKSMQEARAGKTRLLTEALDELGSKYN